MNSKIILILFKSYISIILSSVIGITATIVFLTSKIGNFYPPMTVLFLFLYFFGGGLLCIFFLLPIGIIDRKAIEEKTAVVLIKRYLPIITLPLSILFACLLFADYNLPEDHYYPLIILSNIIFICYVGLWKFIKHIKSSINETTH